SRRRLSLKGGKRRLRTTPLKSHGAPISSKMDINFMEVMQNRHGLLRSSGNRRKTGALNDIHALQRPAVDLQSTRPLRAERQASAFRRSETQSARRRSAQAGIPQAQS